MVDRDLTEKMVKAVGFRNLIAHEYEKFDLKQVHKVAQKDIEDNYRFCHRPTQTDTDSYHFSSIDLIEEKQSSLSRNIANHRLILWA